MLGQWPFILTDAPLPTVHYAPRLGTGQLCNYKGDFFVIFLFGLCICDLLIDLMATGKLLLNWEFWLVYKFWRKNIDRIIYEVMIRCQCPLPIWSTNQAFYTKHETGERDLSQTIHLHPLMWYIYLSLE